ncbi:hypothetical protein Q1695_005764 [Nippostrongylus brasiliensis]|nr:hypothetical protein Q1695_005764 [Nippostrongylus brasiliensis]
MVNAALGCRYPKPWLNPLDPMGVVRTLLRAHLSAIGTSALRFFTPTANGFRVSFNGSITFHRLGQKQEEHSEEEPKSNEVDHLRRMCNVARLEAEIRELELKHRLKVDELSRMFKDQ